MNKKITFHIIFSIIIFLFNACAEFDFQYPIETPPAILGCVDSSACNYDRYATKDNDSCVYPKENYNCSDECIVEIDCSGVCGGDAGIVDFCGVCGGENFCNTLEMVSSVSGEDICIGGAFGDDFGGPNIDECGVCNGDGSSCYDFGNRWVDFNELNDLVTYSIDSQSIEYNDVIKYIGEPEYLEVLKKDNSNYILMWYQYKSKFYPISKTKHIINKDNVYISMETEEIKPPMSGENEKWSDDENYLLIVFNNNNFEVFFVPFDNNREPEFLRKYLLHE